MRVVATAGHVDHGKSTLVRALTGMDPDRFAEEKARGLTIDLGFAWSQLPSGDEVAFVDVPGHVRFIKNMLAGVGAVDACVFVVAATEGWKLQSEEHLRILELLGVSRGLVALTKVGLVDDEWRELARMEVADRVAGTFLGGAEVVAVDAVTGVGVGELRLALDRLVAATPAAVDRGRPRLWVDRAFAARGSGTVVTGTLAGGRLRAGDELVVVPGDRRVRVRALQSLQRPCEEVPPGSRVAVNLTGVHHDDVRRGDALVERDRWRPTRMLDASLHVLASLDHDVSRRGAYAAYLGAGEYPVAVRLLGGASALAPGETGFVRLHLPVALPLLPGDRYVLREFGRGETVGGGEVLDVAPVRPAARARPSRDVDRVVAERGWIDAAELEAITGERRAPTIGRWVAAPDAVAAVADGLRRAIEDAGSLGLDVAALDDRQRAVLATLDDVVVDAGRALPRAVARSLSATSVVPDANNSPKPSVAAGGIADQLAAHPYLDALERAPFAPPSPDDAGVDRAELRELVRRGLVVERDGVWFAPSAVDAAARTVAGLLADRPGGVTASEVREALGTSRKYALPLLAILDATGVTRRRGDVRIAGPRLPAAPAPDR